MLCVPGEFRSIILKRDHLSSPAKSLMLAINRSAAERANEVRSFNNQSSDDCNEADGNKKGLHFLGCFGSHDFSFDCPFIKEHPCRAMHV